jgi:hypothetical protein
MLRRPRLHLADSPHHIVQRGHNRAACFLAEEDYQTYRHWLGEALTKTGAALHAELNPVRAAMVRDPGEYPWSSYRANGLGASDPLLSPHPLYLQLGASPESRQAGVAKGLQQCAQQGEAGTLLRQLMRKFGPEAERSRLW